MLRRRPVLSIRRYSSKLNEWINQSASESAALSNGQMEFKTGHMARFASGACTVTFHDSTVLSTVVTEPSSSSTSSFSSGKSLSVDFLQSASAVGRIPMNYLRRELSQSDMDILISRMIDRSIRPIFSDGYKGSTKVICKPLSLARGGDLAVLGINSASCGLALSEVPYPETVAACRVALFNNEFLLNPPHSELEKSDMNLLLSGTKEKKVVMIEMDGKEIELEMFLEAIEAGFQDINTIITSIDTLKASHGKQKFNESILMSREEKELTERLLEMSQHQLEYIFTDTTHLKTSRDEAINNFRKELVEQVLKSNDKPNEVTVNTAFALVVKYILRKLTRETGVRVDGRQIDEFRPINIETDLYSGLHGSAVFQRGQSQVLGTVTFDSPQSAFRPDAVAQLLGAQQKKSFMVHYEFPQFAVGRATDSSGRFNRRSLGHGTLAEKCLKHVVPSNFPYCVRVDCQVLESNGSTSMASACVGSLAMFDAGVPLKNPVGGVAIGLISNEGDPLGKEGGDPVILTDLMGMEDYAGDMDFKMGGTSLGFTAIQLDVSVPGITMDLVRKSLERGRTAIDYCLGKMSEALPTPRQTFKPCVPLLEQVLLRQHQRSALFRNGAMNAKLIEAETGVQVQADEDEKVLLLAPTKEDAEKAKELIKKLTEVTMEVDPPFGEIQKGEVIEVLERGVRVKLLAFREPVYIPVKDLSNKQVKHTSALSINTGDQLHLQFLGRNPDNGQIRLSLKSLKTSELPLRK